MLRSDAGSHSPESPSARTVADRPLAVGDGWVVRLDDAALQHPALPWTLGADIPQSDAGLLLKATTAVAMALADRLADVGHPLPPHGLGDLLSLAIQAWSVDGSERTRLEAAYMTALVEIS